MPICVRVLALFGTLLAFVILVTPAAAADPRQSCQAPANLFEDFLAMRAQRAGLQVIRFKAAQGVIRAPASELAALPSAYRHYDLVLIDPTQPDRPLSIEATIGKVNSPVKRLQIVKDSLAMRYGVDLPGLSIGAGKLKSVWVGGYRPSQAILLAMRDKGIGYYNYLDGESNIMELNEYYRPTVTAMRTVFQPGPLTEYARQLADQQMHGDANLGSALQAIGVIVEIGTDIGNALHHRQIADEVERALALEIQELRSQYGASETFLADITSGSDRAGPYGDWWSICSPTLTYAHVSDVGPYRCQPGSKQDLPTISANGQYLKSVRVCMTGLGASLPSQGGGYNECEVMQDPECKSRPQPHSDDTSTSTGAGTRGVSVSVEANINRAGGDYGQLELAQPNVELCRSACANDVRCRAYTYVNPGVQGPKAHCWLKSAVTQPLQSACCVSGIKQ